MREKHNKKKKQLNSYLKYSSLVTQMAAIIIAGAFLGDYLDYRNQLNTPVYTIILSLISIFIALYSVLKNTINQHENK